MQAYIVRRLLALIPTLFFASLIVFITVRLMPGSVIDLMLSMNDISADKMSRDDLIAALGLDKPMWEQYLRWAGGILLHGDFGRSLWQNTPVAELLAPQELAHRPIPPTKHATRCTAETDHAARTAIAPRGYRFQSRGDAIPPPAESEQAAWPAT